MFHSFTLFEFPGAPDSPVIQKELCRVTAVSINLVWLSGFNGGSKQTFTVIYKQEGTSKDSTSSEMTDPGYMQKASLFIGGLTESSNYTFTVQSVNAFKTNNNNFSASVTLETKGNFFLLSS